jgi:uncharacterized protein (TIGR03435 family)
MRHPLAFLVLLTSAAASAQEAPRIEVVSIKKTPDGVAGGSFGNRPGGGVVTVNMPMSSLISLAYTLQDSDRIEGAPDWFFREGFDVNATYAGRPEGEGLQELWRQVFAERFRLKARLEQREVPAFNVVLARPERGVPPGLTKIDVDCGALRAAARRGEKWPELPPLPNGMAPCSSAYRGSTITSGGMPVEQFLRSIQGGTGRILIDKTGLAGTYAFELKYASTRPGAANPDNLPELFTALQEQLGLRVEPARAMTDYLIIEHIERPTPD